MSAKEPEDLIARHEAFLRRGAADRPLVGCWVGGYYPAEQFPRGVSGWAVSARLEPEDVSFARFADDYEELYRSHRACDDDFFYVGSAYWGIPWLEAILGCSVSVAEANCRAEPSLEAVERWSGKSSIGVSPMRSGRSTDPISCADEQTRHPLAPFPAGKLSHEDGRSPSPLMGEDRWGCSLVPRPELGFDDAAGSADTTHSHGQQVAHGTGSPPKRQLDSARGGEPGDHPDAPVLDLDPDANRWLDALLGFTEELVAFSDGRFPVCPPLLRGPGDAACALLGGTDFVTGMLDEPEKTRDLLARCGKVRLEVLRRLAEVVPAWHGTHAAGGYPSRVWCKRTVAYYQEDCAALLSPNLFREFILPEARRACRAAEVNFIHLHSACLYPVDVLLEDDVFDVLEINIDHRGSGPAVPELLTTFEKIQRTEKPLLLWGECSPDEWELIYSRLDARGLSLQPMIRSPETKWRNL